MKKLLLTSILIMSLIALAACGSDDDASAEGSSKLDELKEAGKVTVGFADEKPYGYENEDGELTGASVDTAKAVFKELGIDEVEGELKEYSNLISGLNAGKYDVITSGMAIKPDRCENVAFAQPDMKYGEGLIVEEGNPHDLHSYEDIADSDIEVAIMQGATEIDYVQTEGVDEGQIQEVPDIPASFTAVSSGRAQATTGTELTVKMALETADGGLEFVDDFKQPNIDGVPSYGAAAFQEDNTELVEAYNETLEKLKEDGTIDEILEDNYFSAEGNSVSTDVTAESVCSGDIYDN